MPVGCPVYLPLIHKGLLLSLSQENSAYIVDREGDIAHYGKLNNWHK